MRHRVLASSLAGLIGCSTLGGQDPSEEGMYSDDVQVEVDGVFVQCGNVDETNSYWQIGALGPVIYRKMPIVCMGPQSTPDFDLDDATLVGGGYEFPDWTPEIAARCAAACMAAHDPEAEQEPVCVEAAFAPNPAWGEWSPADGPNCDSTLFADDQGP